MMDTTHLSISHTRENFEFHHQLKKTNQIENFDQNIKRWPKCVGKKTQCHHKDASEFL